MLKNLLLALLLVLGLLAPAAAHAQIGIPPTGSNYQVKFRAYPNTASVCLFVVTAPASVTTGVDRLPPPGFDKADALACTNAVVADGATVNIITATMPAPLPTTDPLVAFISYPAAGDVGHPASGFSNLGVLYVALRPVDIVP